MVCWFVLLFAGVLLSWYCCDVLLLMYAYRLIVWYYLKVKCLILLVKIAFACLVDVWVCVFACVSFGFAD